MSRQEFAATYGADPADLASVEAFARETSTKAMARVALLCSPVRHGQ
jgi:hypothetical protein